MSSQNKQKNRSKKKDNLKKNEDFRIVRGEGQEYYDNAFACDFDRKSPPPADGGVYEGSGKNNDNHDNNVSKSVPKASIKNQPEALSSKASQNNTTTGKTNNLKYIKEKSRKSSRVKINKPLKSKGCNNIICLSYVDDFVFDSDNELIFKYNNVLSMNERSIELNFPDMIDDAETIRNPEESKMNHRREFCCYDFERMEEYSNSITINHIKFK